MVHTLQISPTAMDIFIAIQIVTQASKRRITTKKLEQETVIMGENIDTSDKKKQWNVDMEATVL